MSGDRLPAERRAGALFPDRPLQPTEIAAKAVLVQLLTGFDVPEAAIVGADLIRQHDPELFVFPQSAELQFEVDQLDAHAEEETVRKSFTRSAICIISSIS